MLVYSDIYRIDEVLARTFNMVCMEINCYMKEAVNFVIAFWKYCESALHDDCHFVVNTSISPGRSSFGLYLLHLSEILPADFP